MILDESFERTSKWNCNLDVQQLTEVCPTKKFWDKELAYITVI